MTVALHYPSGDVRQGVGLQAVQTFGKHHPILVGLEDGHKKPQKKKTKTEGWQVHITQPKQVDRHGTDMVAALG